MDEESHSLGTNSDERYVAWRRREAKVHDAHCQQGQESPLFNEKERVALEYAEAMTRVDDDLEEQLKNDWGDDEIVELTAFIAS